MLVSTAVVSPPPGDVSSPPFKTYLEEKYVQSSTISTTVPNRHRPRANPQTNQYLDVHAPSPSLIADLANPPTSFSDPTLNLKTNLTAAQIIQFRVPHSTIELHVTTTKHVDGQILGNALLAMHEWLNHKIASRGDSTLADRKDDPFVWAPDGPEPRTRKFVSLTAQSAKGEHMTYGVLLVAVEGLYLCLPAVGRDYGAQFQIWDWRDQAMWGYGEVKGL